jgi:histidinol-phosphate aminotransferase
MLQQGVIIRPLGLFYMPDFIRVSIGTHLENERFLEALTSTLAELDEKPVELSWSAEPRAGKITV